MTAHHNRVRAVLLLAEIDADRRAGWGEPALTIADLTFRLTRIRARLDQLRLPVDSTARGGDDDFDLIDDVDLTDDIDLTDDSDAEAWKLAAYDATLAELCAKLELPHALDDAGAWPEAERLRVELELLTSCG